MGYKNVVDQNLRGACCALHPSKSATAHYSYATRGRTTAEWLHFFASFTSNQSDSVHVYDLSQYLPLS